MSSLYLGDKDLHSFVWNTSLGGPVYLYQSPTGWQGAYVRSNTNGIGAISGFLHFPYSSMTETKLVGTWDEMSGNYGDVTFDTVSQNKLSGFFTIGDDKKLQIPWTSTAPALKGDEEIQNSLFPYQLRWVEAMNVQRFDICASLYTQDASFIMYHALGKDKHKVAKGQKEIREWWQAVVKDLKLRNMQAEGSKVIVTSSNEVVVAYDRVWFGNEEDKDTVAFNGCIHCEVWVRRDGAWCVKNDVTEAKN